MANIIKKYCKSSNLFIIRYIGDTNKTLLERCFWVFVLIVTTGHMVALLYLDWKTLRNGPFRVSVDDSGLRVANFDFPALIICPYENINPKKLDRLITSMLGPTPDEETVRNFQNSLTALSKVTNPHWREGYNYLLSTNSTPFPVSNTDIIPLFKSVLPSIEELFAICYWRGSERPCLEMLRLQSSEFGLCYSFNSFTSARHDNDSNTSPPFINGEGEFVGLRTDSEGRSNCVEFFLQPKHDKTVNDIIFLVGASSPETYPDLNALNPIRAMPTMTYRIEIQLEVEQADISLWQMDKEALTCSLGKVASVENCLLQCRHNHIWRHCQCALYTHAILLRNENVQICGTQHLKCIAELTETLNGMQLVSQPPLQEQPDLLECYCKPPCSRAIYHVRHEITPKESEILRKKEFSVAIEMFYFSKRAMGYVKKSRLTFSNLLVEPPKVDPRLSPARPDQFCELWRDKWSHCWSKCDELYRNNSCAC